MSSVGGDFGRGRVGDFEVPFSEAGESEAAALEAESSARTARAGRKAPAAYDLRLEPKVTEPLVQMSVARKNELSVGAGIGGPLKAQGGEIGVEIEGKTISVKTRRGDALSGKLDELRAKIEAAGYQVSVTALPTIDTYGAVWKIEKAPAPAPAPAGALSVIDTERIVSLRATGPDSLSIGVGFGAGFTTSGGEIGVAIDGQRFVVKTKAGESGTEKVRELKAKIEAAGYQVAETRRPAIDTFEATWKISKAGAKPPAAPAGGPGKTGEELAADVRRMLRGKVTPREAEKMKAIATSIPIIESRHLPEGLRERAQTFGDMIVKLREYGKLYDFLMAVCEMQLERYPPVPAGPTIQHIGNVLDRYGLAEAKKAFDASLGFPDLWPDRSGAVKLGELSKPGDRLGGESFTLRPGGALVFRTRENQIRGMELAAKPAGAVEIERKAIERPPSGMLGGSTLWEYTIRLPDDAKAGDVVKLTSKPHHQVRDDPDWKFKFEVRVP